MSRPYRKTKRSSAEEATRQRIIDATIALHEEIGPRSTTISAVAARAGVQRLTVYRHFPDERRLFEACTSGWLTRNPLPELAEWASEADPLERCRRAVVAFFRYYEKTSAMWAAAHRDEAHVPALEEPMAAVRAYLDHIADELASAFPGASHEVCSTIRHAIAYSTWYELSSQRPAVKDAAGLACRWIEGLADS